VLKFKRKFQRQNLGARHVVGSQHHVSEALITVKVVVSIVEEAE
jgi:hypothetical protein